jgi:hypothetical protein
MPNPRQTLLQQRQATNQLAPQQRTVCYSFEATSADRDSRGVFTFRLPRPAQNTSELSLASFECRTAEPSVTAQENRVVWTEGLRLTPGPESTATHGFNLFSHEIALRETAADGSFRYFKVGLCPALNEVSSFTYNGGWRANHETTRAVAAGEVFCTTNAKDKNGAPHYVGPFQAWQAANAAKPAARADAGTSAMRLRGVCMATVDQPIDFGDSAVVVAADTDHTPPANCRSGFAFADGAWANRLATTGSAATVYTASVTGGFVACSPWFPAQIASFLTFQLATVTNIASDGSHGTDGETPANQYRVAFERGRFRVVRTSGTREFALLGNSATDAAYKYGGMQWHVSPDESPESTNTTTPATAPNGYAGSAATLLACLGFGGPVAKSRSAPARASAGGSSAAAAQTAHGVFAGAAFAATFSTTVAAAFYTPATLATAVTQAMNGSALAHSAAAGTLLTSVAHFGFVDSTGAAHAVTLGPGRRTPFQLAESLAFQLSRLDRRGVYHSASGALVNTAALGPATAQTAGASGRRVMYTVTFDATAQQFAFSNQEIATCAFANAGSVQHSPLVNNGAFDAAPVRHTFELNFRKSDLPAALATTLGVAAFNTTAAAALLGFVGERVYRGTRIAGTEPVAAPHYATTLSRGLANDATTPGTRPLGQALDGTDYTFCERAYGGAGPENRLFGRWLYTFSSSAFNDKRYTLVARAPPTASTAVSSSGTGTGLQVTVSAVAQNTVVTLAATPAAAGAGYSVHDVVTITDGDALAVVQYVGGSGQVLQVGLVYGGSGVSGEYASSGTKTTTAVLSGASRALRVADGQARAQPPSAAADAVSTAVVQCALVAENLNPTGRGLSSGTALSGGSDVVAYRGAQGSLGASTGDAVTLGYCGTALLVGPADKAATLTFTVAAVSGGAIAAVSTFLDGGGANTCRVGEHYAVLQGDGGSVLRCTAESATAPGFEVARSGGGHFYAAAVGLFGPVPLNSTAVVIDVVQPTYRRTAPWSSDVATQYALRQAADPTFATRAQNSYHRDGSMVKLRLAAQLQFNAARNLESFGQLDAPAFQVLNNVDDADRHDRRDDTVWPILGQPDDSAVATPWLRLQREWDLDRQNNMFLTLERPRGVTNHTYTVQGRQCDNVLTKISYNAQLNKQYGALHAQKLRRERVDAIQVRLLDHRLRDADVDAFTVSFNMVETL